MLNLNYFKTIKLKTYLILGLITLIIILFIISFKFTKKTPKSQFSSSPIAQPSSLINPYTSLPPLPSNIPPPNDQLKKERLDDPLIGGQLKEIYAQKPWLNKLPVATKSYVIVYDWQKNQIRVRIIIAASSTLSYEQQVNQIKSESIKKLEEIGVDLTKEKAYYTFTP